MALDRRLTRLRALVERIERLPASARREWMLREARARMVDVETGHEPRPMRTLDEEPPAKALEPPATALEPPAPRVSNGRAVKRPSFKPSPVVAARPRPQDNGDTQEGPLPVPEPPRSRSPGPDPSPAMLGDDEVLWLEDQPGRAVTEPDTDSNGTAPWRRGLRG